MQQILIFFIIYSNRAFGLENQFIMQSEKHVDNNNVCYYPAIITNRWLAVWLENIGNLVSTLFNFTLERMAKAVSFWS